MKKKPLSWLIAEQHPNMATAHARVMALDFDFKLASWRAIKSLHA